MLGALLRGRADLIGGESEPFGQQRRRALETFARNPGHFRAARLFVFGAGSSSGAALAGHGERFVGLSKGSLDPARGLAQFGHFGFSGGELSAEPGAHGVTGFDFADQARRFGGDDIAFLGDLFKPPGDR